MGFCLRFSGKLLELCFYFGDLVTTLGWLKSRDTSWKLFGVVTAPAPAVLPAYQHTACHSSCLSQAHIPFTPSFTLFLVERA